jgi:hypothetical protein
MTVDWANSEVREMALQGKREAMMEQNLEVVEIFNHNRRLGKPPNLETVRFAVMEAGCDRSIVADTMNTVCAWGLRGGHWECASLDAWCEERIEAGDSKGRWLRLKLQELRAANQKIDFETGKYDDGEADQFAIHNHKWNQVSSVVKFPRSFNPHVTFRNRCTHTGGLGLIDLTTHFLDGSTI